MVALFFLFAAALNAWVVWSLMDQEGNSKVTTFLMHLNGVCAFYNVFQFFKHLQ